MNTQFTDKQIEAYAAAFRDGDAIWCRGEWRRVIEENDLFLQSKALLGEGCYYTIKRFKKEENKTIISGFLYNFGTKSRYRVTTLADYTLQGGEKIVWLGGSNHYRTFGKVYEVNSDARYRDNEGESLPAVSPFWGIIPRYEQVKNLGKTTITKKVNQVVRDEMNNERPASSHYHTNNNGNDVWQFADDNLSDERVKGFHQINALKYIARYEKKHDTAEKRIEDLEKAKVSIDKLIELEVEGYHG